jgi:hypothetical protein
MIRRSWPGISPEKVDLESGVFNSYKIHSSRVAAKSLHSIHILFERELPIQRMYCARLKGHRVFENFQSAKYFPLSPWEATWVQRGKKKKAKKNSTGLISTDYSGCLEIMHGRIGSFGALARTLHWNFPQEHLFSSPKFRDVKRNPEAVHDAFR